MYTSRKTRVAYRDHELYQTFLAYSLCTVVRHIGLAGSQAAYSTDIVRRARTM